MIRRSDLVDGLLSVLERKVKQAERQLLELTVRDFIDKLQLTEDGRVRNTLYNKRLLGNIDTVFDRFGNTAGVELARMVAQGVQSVINFNGQYYRMFTAKAQLLPIDRSVKEFMQSWLGLTERGAVKANGYLDTLIKDTTVKNQIKDFALRSVVGQQGWMESKRQLGEIVTGNQQKTGRLSQYYRNFVYDTYSQVDRATGEVYAEGLGFNFAIYEGGIIKTTRKFCKEHNGNVYHRKEIEQFDPKVAKPPNYNPFTDLGGYGCRHHLNWIPDSLALMLRDDAKDFVNKSDKPISEKVSSYAEKTEELLRNQNRPYETVYRDFEAKSISEAKTTKQLKEEFGRPIKTDYIFDKKTEPLPSKVTDYMRDMGGKYYLDKEFENQKPVNLKISDLNISQEFVFENPLKNSTGDKNIYVIRSGGNNYVIDGNHTASKRLLSGEETVKALVLTVK